MTKEIRMLQNDPPPGVWAAAKGDKLTELEAQLQVATAGVFCVLAGLEVHTERAVHNHD
jgi:hypothetical protein